MKNFIKVFHRVVLFSLVLICNQTIAQDSLKTIIDPTNPGNSIPLPANQIEKSCIFIQDLSTINSKNSKDKLVLTIEIHNFDSRYKLLPAYLIDGIEYCDNGNYNDKVAGDGIFTSVSEYKVTKSKSSQEINVFQGVNFQYSSELGKFFNSKYNSSTKSSIKFGCKVRVVTCPETNWWNSCWPFSSPCSCLEFYDCEVGLEIDL